MPKRKKSTTPWNQNNENNPWAQNLLRLKQEHKGFAPKFIKNDPERVSLMEDYGYKVADCKDYGYTPLENEGSVDTVLHRGDLILMETPMEWKEARTKHFDKMIEDNQKTAFDIAADTAREVAKESGEDGIFDAEIHI